MTPAVAMAGFMGQAETIQYVPARRVVNDSSLEISRGCGLDRRNEWRKVLLAWDDTRC